MNMIGVSQNIKCSRNHDLEDTVDQKIINFLKYCDLLPIPISNKLIDETSNYYLLSFLEKIPLSGILLTGGNDLGSFSDRDKTELNLIDYSIQKSIPILGICRGMQVIAYWAGIGIKRVVGHVNIKHMVRGQKNCEVNSYHNFSIKSCPKDFSVIAKSLDGEIEAIRHKKFNLEGWMWHPERETEFKDQDIKSIKRIFKSF